MDYVIKDDKIILSLKGRIDSNNAASCEQDIMDAIEKNSDLEPSFEMSELDYISSAGLRVILKVAKKGKNKIRITDVNSDVYDIFETTGFTELFDVKKKPKEISVEGLKKIGEGFYGTVYRIDADTIVKVYNSADAINMIENEKKMAKMAFVNGIPTAISYDIVKVGDSYGSVFELLDAKTFNDLIIEEPEKTDEIIDKYVDVMKLVHETEIENGLLPGAREVFLNSLESLKEYTGEELYNKIKEFLNGFEEDNHVLHGDFQMKNVMMTEGEPMLIDMDTLSLGQPVFDLQGLYVTYQLFKEDEPDNTLNFLGISAKTSDYIWENVIKKYYADVTDAELEKVLREIYILGRIRFMSIVVNSDLKNGELGELRIKHSIEDLNRRF